MFRYSTIQRYSSTLSLSQIFFTIVAKIGQWVATVCRGPLSRLVGGIPQILILKNLRQSGWIALYVYVF